MRKTLLALLLALLFLPALPPLLAQDTLPRLTAPGSLCLEGATLSWRAVEGAEAYRVRWRASGQPGEGMTLPPTSTSLELHDLQPETTYAIQVQSQASESEARDSFWSRSLRVRPGALATPQSTAESTTATDARETTHCVGIDAFNRVQEFETLCFDLDLNETAPCVYRRACAGTCSRESPTFCPVEQESCDPWQFGQFIASAGVRNVEEYSSAAALHDALDTPPENAHDFVGA